MKNQNIGFTRSVRQDVEGRAVQVGPGADRVDCSDHASHRAAGQDYDLGSLSGGYADSARALLYHEPPSHTISAYEPVTMRAVDVRWQGNFTANLVLNNGGHVVNPKLSPVPIP